MSQFISGILTILLLGIGIFGQSPSTTSEPSAEAILKKAVQTLGGDKYLNIKSQIGRGRFSSMKDGVIVSFQSFVDVIVFPDKERTEFRGGGVRTVQTNAGASGWVYDGEQDLIKIQDARQVENF